MQQTLRGEDFLSDLPTAGSGSWPGSHLRRPAHKTAAEADTLDTVRKLAGSQSAE
jgi:hypothetical protein